VLAATAQAVIFQFSFVVSYYDGVLDEMNTYDSDGFACVFVFLWCEAEGVVEKKRERKDNVQ
jgi:hypothetical protein